MLVKRAKRRTKVNLRAGQLHYFGVATPYFTYETNQSSHRYSEAKALPPRIASEWFRPRFLSLLGLKGMLFEKAIVSSTPFRLGAWGSKLYYDIFSRIA